MSESDQEEATNRQLPSDEAERPARRWSRAATTWVVAAVLLLAIAALGGLAAAYLVASMRSVPPPDAAFLPTPTPLATATSTAPATPSPAAATPTIAPTATPPTPTDGGPSPEPTPEPTPFEYVVQPGDSISRIAARFGVTPESIIELNELRNPNRILPDQVLLIPGAPNITPSPSP